MKVEGLDTEKGKVVNIRKQRSNRGNYTEGEGVT